jgi:tetratricopeptide (TPR) repeat protein
VDWLNPADGLLPEGINPAEPSGDRNTETGNPTYYPGNGGNSGPAKPNVKKLQKDLDDLLKNLNLQAELAENEEDYLKAMEIYGQAQEEISKMIEQYREAGYAEDSDEILRLKNLGYDYAAKQLGGYDKLQDRLVDALNGLTEATEDANALAEKQEAVDKAREALANAEKQRTVRIFNPVTGQWEWVANAADVQKAQENLQKAQDSLQKEQLDQTLKAIKNAKPEDLAGLTLTPAVLDYLFNGTPEQQSAFLDALNAATGGADYLGSAEAQTEFNQGNNIGTQWNLNGITLTEDQAKGMTIQDLLNMLQGLKMM